MLESMPKLSLTKDTPLQIFMFITRPQAIKIEGEKTAVAFAYSVEGAFEEIKKIIPEPGVSINYLGQSIPVSDIINLVEEEKTQEHAEPIKIKIPESTIPEKIAITKMQFILNLKMAAEEMTQNQSLKRRLKKVIGELEKENDAS